MSSMFRKGIVAGVVAVAVTVMASAAAVEREHIGRYSTPEMADLIVWVPPVELAPVVVVQPIAPEPVAVAPAAPVAAMPEPAPEVAEPAAPEPAPGTLVTDDPHAGPYIYDPEQPNEGRPNGAGGWDEDPAPIEP